jgi:hypothetical protein
MREATEDLFLPQLEVSVVKTSFLPTVTLVRYPSVAVDL